MESLWQCLVGAEDELEECDLAATEDRGDEDQVSDDSVEEVLVDDDLLGHDKSIYNLYFYTYIHDNKKTSPYR